MYLNKNTKFQCRNGNAVWFQPQIGDSKVRINGAEALLNDCKLTLIGGARPGQCNLLPDPTTGVPGICTAGWISGRWDNESRVNISGKCVLTNTCSITCPIGGAIRVFKPTVKTFNVYDEMTERCVNTSCSKKNKGEKNTITIDSIDTIKYALCDYKNCSKSRDCEYLKTSHTLLETNESKNAVELKMNMGKDNFDLYAKDCGDIETSAYGRYMYRISHHHIIPVNQCFKQFAEIVKLANYYQYNINKVENGICLPTMNLGYNRKPFELRKNISFRAMNVLGKQWHKGGHQYSCKISDELDQILPRPFMHYKDAVCKELMNFNIKLSSEIKCRCDNYTQQAMEFTKTMDYICGKIAKKINRFEDDSKSSYPFYVSKLAFYYAFQEELSDYETELFREDG